VVQPKFVELETELVLAVERVLLIQTLDFDGADGRKCELYGFTDSRCVAGRLRVRDINDAIRELGQMVAMHTGASSSTFTKLTVLQEAVRVITDLENRLRGMGLTRWNGSVAVETLSLTVFAACHAHIAVSVLPFILGSSGL